MSDDKFESWGIVEVMGHSSFAGYIGEQQIGGTAFVRVDVPECNGRPAFTKLLGSASIFAITPTDEATARAYAAQYASRPMGYLALVAPSVQPQSEPSDVSDDEPIDDDCAQQPCF